MIPHTRRVRAAALLPSTSRRAARSSIANLLEAATSELSDGGVVSARLEAEQLLGHVLGLPRHQLYLDAHRTVTDGQARRLEGMVTRRTRREPLQYIIGMTEFYGLEMECAHASLIPRSETELLVEAVIKLANSFHAPRIVDLGTGTGCIALALARHLPQAEIFALDLSLAALRLAQRNAAHLGLSARLTFLHRDMLAEGSLEDIAPFDLIVSNPPYVLVSERDGLQPEIRDWEPAIALFVEGDGLSFYRAIARLARRHLSETGMVAVEMASQRVAPIAEVFTRAGLSVWGAVCDYNDNVRHLIATTSL